MNRSSTQVLFLAAGFVVAGAGQAALAQEGRFVMERTDSGFVRLDTFTGEMSVCNSAEGQMVCRMAADERLALERQIDQLEDRITELEQVTDGTQAERPGGLPTDEEIDRTFGIMEQMMRRFLGIIEEFEDQDGESEQPGSEKTRYEMPGMRAG